MKRTLLTTLMLISVFLAGCTSPPKLYIPKKAPPAVALKHRPRVAVVLGGGGARGFAHIGVLHTLQKAGVPIDLVVGTSAGSVMGSIYADNGNANQLTQLMHTAKLSDFIDIQNLLGRGGYMKGYGFEKYLMQHMRSKTFKQTKVKFIAMTTDLKTGNPYRIESGPIAPAVLASAAIPGLVVPVKLYGHTLIDGGLANPLAVDVARHFHPQVIIAVDLVNKLDQQIPTNGKQIANRAFVISQLNLGRLRSKGANVIITPQVQNIGIFDVKDKYKTYQLGVSATQKQLPKILALLKQKHIQRVYK